MLRSLRISNYALIESAEWNPSSGLNVITGETGAGKSILLGALGLIRGERADKNVLYNPEQKCVVEGVFELDRDRFEAFFEQHDLDFYSETWLRREFSEQGRSRAFINDSPVVLEVMRSLTQLLIDVHGQRDTSPVLSDEFKFQFFDTPQLETYREDYREYSQLSTRIKQLQSDIQANLRESDYLTFQWNELNDMNLIDGELDELKAELDTLEHGEIIQRFMAQWQAVLEQESVGVLSQLAELKSDAHQLAKRVDSMQAHAERLDALLEELKDLDFELQRSYAQADFDPRELELKSERMHQLQQAMQKHRVAQLADLIALRDSYHEKLSASNGMQEELDQLIEQRSKSETQLQKLASELSAQRTAQIPRLEQMVSQELHKLGMEHAVFKVELEQNESLNSWGFDNLSLLFSANPGSAPLRLEKVASGGEFSRLMLVLKAYLARNHELPTLIFDEIDTGVSGKVATKVGAMLEEMADHMQIVAITHLPQVASKGNSHFRVVKTVQADQTRTEIMALSHEDRIEEIASMLGGAEASEASLRNARELLGY